jgi:3-oxoacyl-[acyl-carrier protein] reductase
MKPCAVVITGAAGGLGATLAERMAASSPLVLVDVDEPALCGLGARLTQQGARCTVLAADVSQPSAVREIVCAAIRRGGADGLVNGAAILGPVGPATEIEAADWDRVLAVNLRSQWLLAAGLYEQLKSAAGAVVNVASTAGRDGSANLAAYAASKGAVMSLTRTLAAEWAADGVRVNAVVPGLLEQGISEDLPPELRETLARKVPLGRAGTCTEVAAVIEFLLSREASYVTGECWGVCGGR